MKELKNVQGSQEHVDGLEFNIDTIYVRNNIRREKFVDEATKESYECWMYDEIQYTYDEYVVILNSKVDKANSAQDDLILDNAYRVAMLELASNI